MSIQRTTDTQAIIRAIKNGEQTPEEALERAEKSFAPNSRSYIQKSTEDKLKQYQKAKLERAEILRNRIPFITEGFLPDFYLSQGLVLVGAESGKSKSTTAANILAGYLKSTDGTAIVVTNEEATDAIFERTACVLCGLSYVDYYNGRLGPMDRAFVEDTVVAIIPRVEVVEDDYWDTAYLEDVKAVLETAATNKVGLVIVDYLQTVTMSRDLPSMESFQVSKQMGFYLKDYGKRYGVPVVVLAQLNSASENRTMADRVQNDKTIFNHAFIAIEIVPDFKTLTTVFKIHKTRFGDHSGKEVVMNYTGGRYHFSNNRGL